MRVKSSSRSSSYAELRHMASSLNGLLCWPTVAERKYALTTGHCEMQILVSVEYSRIFKSDFGEFEIIRIVKIRRFAAALIWPTNKASF